MEVPGKLQAAWFTRVPQESCICHFSRASPLTAQEPQPLGQQVGLDSFPGFCSVPSM